MTDDILAVARRALELDEKATKGPWEFGLLPAHSCKWRVKSTAELVHQPWIAESGGIDNKQPDEDGDFIAFSRSALPALAREVIANRETYRLVTGDLEDAEFLRKKAEEKLATALAALKHCAAFHGSPRAKAALEEIGEATQPEASSADQAPKPPRR